MKTRRSLKPDEPLLVGRIRLNRNGPVRGRPYLTITVWCPYCKRMHTHGWEDPPFRSDGVSHRVSHCTDGPLAHHGYWIGLDPAAADYNRTVARQAIADLTAYQARNRAMAAPLTRT